MNTPTVLGLDLSLTATGLAGNAPGGLGFAITLKPPTKLRDVARLDWIRREITDRYLTLVDLAVMEGPSYGNQGQQRQSGHHERAGLWWLVRVAVEHRGVPVAVVSPAGRAKYATGRGNAGKDDVIREVTRRFSWFEADNNAADALILAAMGADHLGVPMATMPAAHRVALDAVIWPQMPERCEHGLASRPRGDGQPTCAICRRDIATPSATVLQLRPRTA